MDNSRDDLKVKQERRNFIKKAAYIAPTIITMAALPSFASAGSGFTNKRRKLYGNRRPGNNGAPRPPSGL